LTPKGGRAIDDGLSLTTRIGPGIKKERGMLGVYRRDFDRRFATNRKRTIGNRSLSSSRALAIALAMTSGVAMADTAQAQDAGPDAPAVENNDIIVTAERRPERLEDVPISITSISDELLEQANIRGLFDLSTITPGVRVDHYGAYAQPTIRGIGTQDVLGPGANANVAIYVDGFYQPSQTGNIFDFANVNRIDVLKGPQGTLFGQNATGGAILVTTVDPSHTTKFSASVGYGSFNEFRGDFYGTTGLTDSLAADLSVYYRNSDNYFHDVARDKPTAPIHSFDVRSKWKLDLGKSSSLTLILNYSDVNDPTGLAENTVDPIAKFYHDAFGVPMVWTTDTYKTSLNNSVKANPKTYSAALNGQFNLGWANLSSLTQYRHLKADIRADLDGTTIRYWQVKYNEKQKTFTQEFDLTNSDGGVLDWVTGLFYYYDKGTLLNNAFNDIFNTGTNTTWLSSISTVTTNSFAGFADGTYQATDKLYLTAGARYTIEKKELDTEGRLAPFITFNGSQTWHRLTPRAAIRYELNPRSNIYASISRGFMSGNYAYASVGPQVPVDPERATQYEIGYKTHRGRFSLDLAAYLTNYKDLQVFLFDDICQCFQLDNAPKARIYGAEAQTSFDINKYLSVIAGAAYTHARYKDFLGVGLTGLPVIPPDYGLGAAPTDFSGDPMIRAPKFTGSLTTNFRYPTSIGELGLSGTVYYSSRVPFTPDLQLSQSPYTLVNLNASLTDRSQHWIFTVWGSNVFDKKYLIFAGGGFLGLNRIAGPSASVGFRIGYNY